MLAILDSSIICRDFRMEGAAFRMFFEGAKRGALMISIPQIVLDEVANKYREEVYARLQSIDKNLAYLKRIVKSDSAFTQFDMMDAEQVSIEYGAFLEKKLADNGATILDYPNSSHEDLVHRALSRKKPFSASGSGYRDALIWDGVLDAARNSDKTVVLLTSNSKDFSDKEGRLHDDLRSDLRSLGIPERTVVLCGSLDEFVNTHIKPNLEDSSETSSLVRRDLEALDVKTWLEEHLDDIMRDIEWDPLDVGLDGNYEHVTVDELQDVLSIEIDSVAQLNLQNVYVSIDVKLKVLLAFNIRNPDYTSLYKDEDLTLDIPREWHLFIDYPFGSKIASVVANVLLLWDLDAKQIKEIEIRALSEAKDS